MDLDTLSKNIQNLIQKKNTLLVIVVILIFIVIAAVLFGDFSLKFNDLRTQNQKKQDKMSRVSQYDNSKKELNDFVVTLPKPKSADALVDLVADYAVKEHVQITDISFKDTQKFEYYTTTAINMNARVRNFKDLVSFFNTIETASISLKVESWKGRAEDLTTGSIDCEIIIVATQTI